MDAPSEYVYKFLPVDYVVIITYLGILISVGFILKRFCHNVRDYFIGGSKVTWWLAGASTFMMSFSAWTFTGAAGFAYKYGILAILLFFFNAAAYFFTALFIAAKCRQSRCVTFLEIVQERFGRVAEQFFAWIEILRRLFGGAIWLSGFGMFAAIAFGIPIELTIFISGAVIMIYSTIGGSWAVIATDFLQSVVLVTLTLVIAVLTLNKIGGVLELLTKVSPDRLQILDQVHTRWWVLAYFFNIFLMFSAVTGAPRYLCVKDGRNAKKAALLASVLFLLGPVVWFLPPIAASHFFPDIAATLPNFNNPHEGAYVLMGLTVLPHGLSALLIMVIFGATLSSMDSTMNQNAGIITMNLYKPLLRPKASDRELFLVGHVFNVLFGIVVIAVALFFTGQKEMGLFELTVFLITTVSLPMSVPLFLIYWIRRTPKCAAVISTASGILYSTITQHGLLLGDTAGCWICTMLHRIGITQFDTHPRWPLTLVVFGGIIISGSVFFLTMLFWRFTSRRNKNDIDVFYEKLNRPVDFEHEVVGSEDVRQLIIIGTLIMIVGGGVLLLLLVPNTWQGRLVILAAGAMISTIGVVLFHLGKRSKARLGNQLIKK